MKKNSKIAIVTGGTGGHLFPAISLTEQLIAEKKKIIFLSDNRVKRIINKNKFLYKNKNVVFYSFEISRSIKKILYYFLNLFKIFKILRKNNPDIVISFGGYTSIPFLLISKLLLKPIILHESNATMGSANKLFYFFSQKVIYGWGDKKKNENKEKIFYIRNPVRKKVLNLRKKVKNYINKKSIILIVGGSQGAAIFDKVIPGSLNLLPNNIKKKIKIYHQCSKLNYINVKKNYKKNKINATCKKFFNDLPNIMYKCQFVISRSGSSTLSEITALGKPSILIPYKFAKNNHQQKNAEWLVNKGAGIMVLENEFNENQLKNKITDFIKNKKKIRKMSKNSFLIGDENSLFKLVKTIC